MINKNDDYIICQADVHVNRVPDVKKLDIMAEYIIEYSQNVHNQYQTQGGNTEVHVSII